MQVLGFLYLSLKCANSENSFILRLEKKKDYKYSDILHKSDEADWMSRAGRCARGWAPVLGLLSRCPCADVRAHL